MITRFYGIDKHKKYFTKSVLNRKGNEVYIKQKCYDLKEYVHVNFDNVYRIILFKHRPHYCA